MGKLNIINLQNNIEIEGTFEEEAIREFLDKNLKLREICERECFIISLNECLLLEEPEHLCPLSGLKVVKIAENTNPYRITYARNYEIMNFKSKLGLM